MLQIEPYIETHLHVLLCNDRTSFKYMSIAYYECSSFKYTPIALKFLQALNPLRFVNAFSSFSSLSLYCETLFTLCRFEPYIFKSRPPALRYLVLILPLGWLLAFTFLLPNLNADPLDYWLLRTCYEMPMLSTTSAICCKSDRVGDNLLLMFSLFLQLFWSIQLLFPQLAATPGFPLFGSYSVVFSCCFPS